jgi:hypothetical protein
VSDTLGAGSGALETELGVSVIVVTFRVPVDVRLVDVANLAGTAQYRGRQKFVTLALTDTLAFRVHLILLAIDTAIFHV